MRKIHVTRQFFEASGSHGDLIEKTKIPFLDKVNGSMCAKFQVCIVVSVARRRDTNKQINKYIHIQVNLGISSAAARLTWILIISNEENYGNFSMLDHEPLLLHQLVSSLNQQMTGLNVNIIPGFL